MFSQRIHIFFTCLAITLCLSTSVNAGPTVSQSANIQAAFLVQFSKYISWPAESFPSAKSPIVIGILGRDPFGSKINQISRTFKAGKRSIAILRLRRTIDARKCHILFITPEQTSNMQEIKDVLADSPALLVSNTEDFLAQGGMINFITVGTKIRFDINRNNSQNCGIKISATLLNIAHQVIQ